MLRTSGWNTGAPLCAGRRQHKASSITSCGRRLGITLGKGVGLCLPQPTRRRWVIFRRNAHLILPSDSLKRGIWGTVGPVAWRNWEYAGIWGPSYAATYRQRQENCRWLATLLGALAQIHPFPRYLDGLAESQLDRDNPTYCAGDHWNLLHGKKAYRCCEHPLSEHTLCPFIQALLLTTAHGTTLFRTNG